MPTDNNLFLALRWQIIALCQSPSVLHCDPRFVNVRVGGRVFASKISPKGQLSVDNVGCMHYLLAIKAVESGTAHSPKM